MRVGMIGLGKLGLPVSTAFALKGHEVYGYDIDAAKVTRYQHGVSGLFEPGLDLLLQEQLANGRLTLTSDKNDLTDLELIFIAVPTPSLSDNSFDTSYVREALRTITVIAPNNPSTTIAVISTVLPGTCRREFLPILAREVATSDFGFAYNAQFIAMGTVLRDILNPEFILIGEGDKASGDVLEAFYQDVTPHVKTMRLSIESAEVVKCAYNNFISFKIVYANTLMELCDKVPYANCDEVSFALSHATDRLLSPKYLQGGMGDGGGCHPRDNRALSYLAQQLGLSADPFAFVTEARKQQTTWIAAKVADAHIKTGLPIKLLGVTFKPNTNLTDDSPALLLRDMLEEMGFAVTAYDPEAEGYYHDEEGEGFVYVIGTAWEDFVNYPFLPGSTIIDPHGLIKHAPNCVLESIGRLP
jgi:UDPglucose 6-dehydrogenase